MRSKVSNTILLLSFFASMVILLTACGGLYTKKLYEPIEQKASSSQSFESQDEKTESETIVPSAISGEHQEGS